METGRKIRIIIFAAIIVVFAYIMAGGFLFPGEQGECLDHARLTQVTDEIQQKLDEIAYITETASNKLAAGVGGEHAQEVLDEAFDATPDAVYFFTFNPDGRTVTVSPRSHTEEPAQIPNTGSLSSLIRSQGPLMTDVFIYENSPAFEIVRPVYDEGGEYIGGIAALVLPYEFLHDIVSPVEESENCTFTVMQTDGLILYDKDSRQVGKNLFTDEIFSNFPNLRNLGVRFASNRDGYGSYMYYPAGENSGRPVKKLAYWNSAGLYGTEWRVIMFREALISG